MQVPVSSGLPVKVAMGPPPSVVTAGSTFERVDTTREVGEDTIEAEEAPEEVVEVSPDWYENVLDRGEQPRKSGMLTL